MNPSVAAKTPAPPWLLSGKHKHARIVEDAERTDLAGIALVLADESCSYCFGSGCVGIYEAKRVCNCVYRRIARECLARYRRIRATGPWGWGGIQRTRSGRLVRGFIDSEFVVEIELCARRVLTGTELRLFEMYELGAGWEWQECARVLRMDRGNFFHAVYAVERKLGKAFSSAGPWGLFPMRRYFGGGVDEAQIGRPMGRTGLTWREDEKSALG
jgi:hypothetical protein